MSPQNPNPAISSKPRRIWIDAKSPAPPFQNGPLTVCPNCGNQSFGPVEFADNSGNKGMSRAGWVLIVIGAITACFYVGYVFLAIGIVMVVAAFIQSPAVKSKGVECLKCHAAWQT